MSEVKFTEEELKSLKDVQDSYQNIQMRMGNLKMQQISHDKMSDQLENLEESLLDELSSLQESEQQLAQTFNEKYGQGQLDPKTGVFTPAPVEKTTTKEAPKKVVTKKEEVTPISIGTDLDSEVNDILNKVDAKDVNELGKEEGADSLTKEQVKDIEKEVDDNESDLNERNCL